MQNWLLLECPWIIQNTNILAKQRCNVTAVFKNWLNLFAIKFSRPNSISRIF